MILSLLTDFRVLVVAEYINSTICAYIQDIMIHKCVNHIQYIMCPYLTVTRYKNPEASQLRPKHVGAVK